MRLRVDRAAIMIIPESPIDEAYLEEVLKLRSEDCRVTGKRVNAMGVNGWAYLEVGPDKE